MPANPQKGKFRRLMRLFLKWGAVAIAVVALIGVGVLLVWSSRREAARLTTANPSDSFETQTVPLDSLAVDFVQKALVVRRVIVNGQLQVGEGMILTPSLQPSAPQPGQLYYDQNTNLLGYFNGTEFVYLDAVEIPDIVIHPSVEQIAGLTGQIGLGPGLTVAGGSLVNNGVISLGGSTGAIAVGAGLSIAGNVLQNSGVLNIVGGSGIQVTDDGSGTYTIANVGAGNGTVSSSGGTVGRIPVFTDVQNIENSLISQSGMTVTVSGDLHVVTGGLSLSNPLTVSNGGTGATSFAPNGVLIGNGTGPITAVTAPGPNLCLLSTAGAPIFTACPSASGVTTLNGLNGALTIANASAAGSIITIDNASTSAKGIAQFSSANFTDNGAGVINTIQDIHTGATPTFAGLNTNSINPSSALTVGAAGQTAFLQGSTATIAAASGDIVLTSAGQIRLTGFNCSAFANGGTLTTDASGNLICANDDGGPGGGVSSVNSLVGDLVLQGTAGQIVVTDNGSDTLTLSLASDVTLQGNTFNGANQLVQLNGFGQLPAVSGALLTNLNGSAISSGTIDNARLVNGGELTVTAGTNLTGGGSVALGGTITLHVTDNPTFSGNVVVEGGIITLGTVGQVGSLVLHDGNGQTTTLQAGDSTGNLTFILPSSAGNVAQCLKQGGGNQLIWDDCEGGLGGISGVVSLNSLGGALTIQGTTNRIVVTDDGNDTITISAPQDIHTAASPTFAGLTLTGDVAVEGGTVTIGSTSQAASLVIHDGDGQTVTLEVGNLASDLTFILPTTAGNSFQCLKKGAGNQLIWDDCEGGSGPSGVTSLNGLVAALTLQGTADQIVVSDDGVDTITLSLGAAVTLQGNTFNGANQLVQLNGSGELPALSGVNLTNLNASALTIGTVSSSVISGAYTGITGVGTISTGTWQGAAIAIAHGGTGATTQQGAINNLAGLTTQGDLLYHDGVNVTRLARGNNGECLVSTATTIQWGSCLGGGALTGSGTPGTIALFTDTDELGDSILSQSGSTITVGGNLNITSGGQIQINGVPISSADLSDGSNLAKLNASQTFTGATVAFQNSSDSTNAFNIQNAAGVRVLTVNTTAGQVELGTAGAVNGSLVFYNANDNNAVTILSDALTDDRTILLPDADGTICLDTGNCADLGATLQTAYNFSLGGTTPKIKVNDTLLGVEIQDADISINDYLLTVRASNNSGLGQVMFGVNSAGEVVIQSSTNSSTALQLLTSAGTSVLAGDTLNGQVILGQGGTLTGALLFSNASNNNLITLTSQTATAARTITLPDADGVICLDSGNCAGVGDVLQGGNSFGTTMTIGTNDNNDLVLERNNAARLTIGANNLTLASGIDLLLQGANAFISNPQGQTNSESFGLNAVVSGANSLAVGAGTSTHSSGGSTAVGAGAEAGVNGTSLGYNSGSQGNAVALGAGAQANSGGIAIGVDADNMAYENSIALGREAFNTDNNQLVIGSGISAIKHVVIGNGVTHSVPVDFLLQGTSGSGTNVAGADVYIAGGQGTGNADGGSILFQTSVAGTSGSTLNALATVLGISGANGAITAQNSTNSTTAFRILNASSMPLFTADTTNLRVYIGDPSADSTGALLVLDTKNTSGDPSGVNGAMYYNAAMGVMRCHMDGRWQMCNGPRSLSWGYNIEEDFVGPNLYTASSIEIQSLYGWEGAIDGSGSDIDMVNPDNTKVGRPGWVVMTVGNNGSWAQMYLLSLNGQLTLGGGEVIETNIFIDNLASSAQDYEINIGLCNADTWCGDNGIFFEYYRPGSGNFWRYRACTNENCTTGVSSKSVQTGNTSLRIVVNSPTSVTYYVKHESDTSWTTLGTITTNIPALATQNKSPFVEISKLNGDSSRSFGVDYFHIRQERTTPR
ncbi:hypothetical protein IRY61_01210 [Candidatus Saccharibacteria bacterium]|nr:hypothetical protein [Candidatus Saccharibacteria bacterium]